MIARAKIQVLVLHSLVNEQIMNLTVGMKTSSSPVYGFSSIISYQNSCNMGELWFDLNLDTMPRVTVDIAGDGDTDWGIDHPAFDALGRQTFFTKITLTVSTEDKRPLQSNWNIRQR